MLAPDLQAQMLEFVKTFFVVKERQIKKFFSDWGYSDAEYALNNLLCYGQLIRHPQDTISFVRTLPEPLSYYEPCITALDVMLMLQSKKIVYFSRESFPTELMFVTTDSQIYDVVVFDELWVGKYATVQQARKRMLLPGGEEDPTNHVAVVPSRDLAIKVDPLGFALYAVVDHDTGKADLFYYD